MQVLPIDATRCTAFAAAWDRDAALRVLATHLGLYVAEKVARLLDEVSPGVATGPSNRPRQDRPDDGAASRMADVVRWTLPTLLPAERVAVLAGPRGCMPPAAFADLLGLAASFLDEPDGLALRASFGAAERSAS